MIVTDWAVSLFLLPPVVLVALVLLLCGGGAFLAWAVLHRAVRLGPEWCPQPPLFAAMIGLFALMLSFAASEAWRRSDNAYAALLRESQEVASLLPLLDALGDTDPAPVAGLRQGLREYLSASLREEWAIRNIRASPAAGAALDRIRSAAAAGLIGPRSAVWRVVQDRVDGLQQARSARLVAGGLYGDALKWGTLVVLYLAGAFAIAAVHLDRRRGVFMALAIYAGAAAMALLLVALSEHPYAGWDAVEPDRLMELSARLAG